MGLLRKFGRWRHGMGFGIHSPFAFRMVNDVLRSRRGYAYYAYPDIARFVRRQRSIDLHSALLIFRAMVALQPQSVTISAARSAEVLRFVASMACPGAKIVESGGELLICEGEDPAPAGSRHAIFTNAANPQAVAMKSALEHGHIYTNGHAIIIADFDHLPLQTFEVKF